MGVYEILKYPKMYWRTCRYAELVAVHTTAKGTGKTRNEERRNGKQEIKSGHLTACSLCIQQHLEWTSATGVSREEVEIIV